MEHYTTLTRNINNIDGNNKLIDALVYAYLKSRMNYSTYISEVTEKEIAAKLGIPLRTIVSCVSRLKKNRLLISKVDEDAVIDKGYKTYNKYHITKENDNYYFIYNSLFKDNIGIDNNTDACKVKGLLLLIKSVCLKETNKYISNKPYKGSINKTELANLIGLDNKTLNKYLEIAIEAKQIKLIDNGLLILNKSIVPDFVEAEQSNTSKPIYTKIFHLIYYWCIANNIVPPNRNDTIIKKNGKVYRTNELLSRIAGKYSITKEDIQELIIKYGIEYIKANIDKFPILNSYIPYVLNKRITNKPNEISLEYITKALNIDASFTNNETNEVWTL